MMRHLIERHRYKSWRLDLLSDGTLFLLGSFKNGKPDQYHSFRFGEPVCNLPRYVVKMVAEMYDAHRGEGFRSPLSMRIDAYRQQPLPKVKGSYSRYVWCEKAGEYYFPWSIEGRKVK